MDNLGTLKKNYPKGGTDSASSSKSKIDSEANSMSTFSEVEYDVL